MKQILLYIILGVLFFASCEEQKEHTAPAILPRDSASVMTSYGVNTLISDSGVIKYRIVTERWDINEVKNPPRWTFDKGVFLEAFDQKFHIYSYIQCDSAIYYNQQKLWVMRGRVRILTKDNIRFSSEELYWDENAHEIYSYKYSRLITPDRRLEGSYFRSDEQMTKYYVSNTRGSFVKGEMMESPSDTMRSQPDSVKSTLRPRATPQPKSSNIP
jgi:LPS export ABC transporter protein LptC